MYSCRASIIFLFIFSLNIYSSESNNSNSDNWKSEQINISDANKSCNSTDLDGWIDIANGWIYDNWR